MARFSDISRAQPLVLQGQRAKRPKINRGRLAARAAELVPGAGFCVDPELAGKLLDSMPDRWRKAFEAHLQRENGPLLTTSLPLPEFAAFALQVSAAADPELQVLGMTLHDTTEEWAGMDVTHVRLNGFADF